LAGESIPTTRISTNWCPLKSIESDGCTFAVRLWIIANVGMNLRNSVSSISSPIHTKKKVMKEKMTELFGSLAAIIELAIPEVKKHAGFFVKMDIGTYQISSVTIFLDGTILLSEVSIVHLC
jgi:hypothetical protein